MRKPNDFMRKPNDFMRKPNDFMRKPSDFIQEIFPVAYKWNVIHTNCIY
jgi:hypothetical protein